MSSGSALAEAFCSRNQMVFEITYLESFKKAKNIVPVIKL